MTDIIIEVQRADGITHRILLKQCKDNQSIVRVNIAALFMLYNSIYNKEIKAIKLYTCEDDFCTELKPLRNK